MSLTRQRENGRCTCLYHQSARLIKSDSLFAVVVTGPAWSGEIIFSHALLTLLLFSSFTRPHFLFVSVFLFTNRLILSSPPLPLHCCFSNSVTFSLTVAVGCTYLALPHLTFPLYPPTLHSPHSRVLRYCRPLSQFTHVWPIVHWTKLSNEHSKDVLHAAQFHAQLVNRQSISNREHTVFDENLYVDSDDPACALSCCTNTITWGSKDVSFSASSTTALTMFLQDFWSDVFYNLEPVC